jgi:hypothetical protein
MPMKTFLILLMLISSNAFAEEAVSEYRNAAAMGHGDTTASWSDSDDVSIFDNPSFLSERNKFSIELINPTLNISTNAIDLIKSHPTSIQNGNIYNQVSPYFGNSYMAQAQASPTITYQGFSFIPFFASGLGEVNVDNPVFSSASGSYYYDKGTALAKGYQVNQDLSFGASAVYYERHAATEEVTLINVLKPLAPYNLTGHALSLGLGANYKLDHNTDTTIGVDVKNIGSPSFWNNVPVSNSTNTQISQLNQEFDFGLSSRFLPTSYFKDKFKFAFEYHQIDGIDQSFADKLSIGIQYDLFSWLNFKTGIYEENLTAGLGVKTSLFAFDVSTYQENSNLGYDESVQHLMVGLRLGFNL